MQRNMDLVRKILMRIEDGASGQAAHPLNIVAFTPEEVGYHAHIMLEDGLIGGINIRSFNSNGPEVMPTTLTWKGHEFLDLARDQERWNKANAIIRKVGSAPIAVWIKVLNELILKDLGAAS